MTLIRRLLANAEKEPNRVAFRFWDEMLSDYLVYTNETLLEGVIGCAIQLRGYARPGDRVIVCSRPGRDFTLAFFAAQFAGLVPVPCFPCATKRTIERLNYIARDCIATLVVCSEKDSGSTEIALRGSSVHSLFLQYECNRGSDTSGVCGKADIAFLQYTSGTTGDTKGVIITQDNLISNVNAIAESFRLEESSVGVIWLPPYHDMGLVGGILTPIYSAFPVCLFPPSKFVREPIFWLQEISRWRATISGGPNFAFAHCVKKLLVKGLGAISLDLSSWKTCFTGSEAINWSVMESFSGLFRPYSFASKAILACYGLAEATLLVSAGRWAHGLTKIACGEKNVIGPVEFVSCGAVVSGHDVMIVNRDGVALPDGKVGRILVSGPSISMGYWKDRGSSEPKIDSIHLGGKRWLRTDDRGFLLHGELYITGRERDHLILNGIKRDPIPIEQALKARFFKSINDALICNNNDDTNFKFLVILELSKQGAAEFASLADAVEKYLIQECELYPLRVIDFAGSAFPKTLSGKIQRHRVRNVIIERLTSARFESRHIARDIATCPREAPSHWLVIWLSEHLKLPIDGIDSSKSIAALGGDSLLCVELLHCIQQKYLVDISFSDLLQLPVWQLEERLEQQNRRKPEILKSKRPRPEVKSSTRFRATSLQEDCWRIITQFNSSSHSNVSRTIRVNGLIEKERLDNAIFYTLQHHPLLCARFAKQANKLDIVIDSMKSVQSSFCECGDKDNAEERIRLFASQTLDLSAGEMLKVEVVKYGEKECYLTLLTHHIVMDGWSSEILYNDLLQHYKDPTLRSPRFEGGETSAGSYAEYARWLRRSILSKDSIQRKYWVSEYYNEPWQSTFPQAPMGVGPLYQKYLLVKRDRYKKVRSFLAGNRLSLMPLIIGVVNYCLLVERDAKTLTVGVRMAGRTNMRFSNTIGLFANLCLLRTSLEGNMTVEDYIKLVAKKAYQVYDNQDFPFPVLRSLMQKRYPNLPPIQIIYSFHNYLSQTEASIIDGDNFQTCVITPDRNALVPLAIHCFGRDNEIMISFSFDERVIPNNNAGTLIEAVDDLLSGLR